MKGAYVTRIGYEITFHCFAIVLKRCNFDSDTFLNMILKAKKERNGAGPQANLAKLTAKHLWQSRGVSLRILQNFLENLFLKHP